MSYSDPPPPPQQPPYGSGEPPQYGGGDGGYAAPPPPPGYGGQPYGAVPAGNNKKAIWALVLGILGICCCGFFAGVPAIILGRSAKTEISATGQGGSGLATAGVVLGVIAIIWGIVQVILYATGTLSFNGDFSTS